MQSYNNNRLVLSVAGSGKTTYLVREAIKIQEQNILITTYTEANEREIKKKFIEIHGFIPSNVTIQTWFSFLLQHGVRPYQGTVFEGEIKGMLLVNSASGIRFVNKHKIAVPYTEENDFVKHYFSSNFKIYSDKISKFVVKCNRQSGGALLNRLSKIYQHIFIDEVQDLAGNDLEILLLFLRSGIRTVMVGDPRQVTYLTHHERKYKKYTNGNIKQFIIEKAPKSCFIDETTLACSHRNNQEICSFSSKLYPELTASTACSCMECRYGEGDHRGVFLVKSCDIDSYKKKYAPAILRYSMSLESEWNFGNCKGLGFDRVLIFPTGAITKYLQDGQLKKTVKGKNGTEEANSFDKAKFYVALTRARHSVAIISDSFFDKHIDGIQEWELEK
ncbi:DNA helicase-2 / ATP-dependent DNA helicase PcrA [Dyadobacter koreensis]|uniref:DNA 3'-5' helicase II n=1 Tax=Dyadobacter koreensis TaxID=408657 RepID=A0A1H6T119_9BACT|nr:UvrD-helicase domain-containing protein [Dyadobacter koreensis]SEI69935.1 DNA helicase-2 / ATP-dependent DNA helicase PcrA [Dyadobacter koreensis]